MGENIETTTAVVYSGFGGENVVSTGPRPLRAPQAGEVLIKVAAAAVSPTDILMRDPGYGDQPPPMTPGMDLSGVVEAVGEGVERLAVGDAVMAAVLPVRPEGGAQAARVVVPAASAVPLPEGVTIVEASTLPMNGLTALYALDTAALSPGQTLAIPGGAGWLSRLVIAIAHARGLKVISDARPDEVELVRGFGADVVVPRSDDFAATARAVEPGGVDVLLDTAVLGEASFGAIRDGGMYIPLRGWAGPDADRGVRIVPIFVTAVLERTDWLETLRDLVHRGVIRPLVDGEYAPEQVVEAQRRLLAGGVRGRPVLIF